ncbi:hypothetical protein C8R42DRAFT_637977 [Lentinula raphanica]|nr:hypothetical protein C8R42DRAFT_637977 [Lentinula raphanica]
MNEKEKQLQYILYDSEIGIVDAILRYLGHNDLDSLSLTGRTGYYAVMIFRKAAMKIEHVLLRFFKTKEEIGKFQSIQAKTGTIISGSVALQFFTRTVYKDSDMDTYSMLKNCLDIGQWYETIGYQYIPAKKQRTIFQDDYRRVIQSREGGSRLNVDGNEGDDIRGAARYQSPNICEVWNFENKDRARIQLVATRIIPEAIVLGFHSTCVMNFITHKAAYSLFPYTTFTKTATVLVNARGRLLNKYDQAIKKYRHRGFTVNTQVPLKYGIEGELGCAVPRWIGDKSTWIHPIEYFGCGEVSDDNSKRIGWDTVYAGRQIFLEYERLFVGEEEGVANEENKQFVLAGIEVELIREYIGGNLQNMNAREIDDIIHKLTTRQPRSKAQQVGLALTRKVITKTIEQHLQRRLSINKVRVIYEFLVDIATIAVIDVNFVAAYQAKEGKIGIRIHIRMGQVSYEEKLKIDARARHLEKARLQMAIFVEN